MSTRAIAPIVGASHMQVARDLAPSLTDVTDGPRTVDSMDEKTRTFQPRPDLRTEPVGPSQPKRRQPLSLQARTGASSGSHVIFPESSNPLRGRDDIRWLQGKL